MGILTGNEKKNLHAYVELSIDNIVVQSFLKNLIEHDEIVIDGTLQMALLSNIIRALKFGPFSDYCGYVVSIVDGVNQKTGANDIWLYLTEKSS